MNKRRLQGGEGVNCSTVGISNYPISIGDGPQSREGAPRAAHPKGVNSYFKIIFVRALSPLA